jgi:hypothetical protein
MVAVKTKLETAVVAEIVDVPHEFRETHDQTGYAPSLTTSMPRISRSKPIDALAGKCRG